MLSQKKASDILKKNTSRMILTDPRSESSLRLTLCEWEYPGNLKEPCEEAESAEDLDEQDRDDQQGIGRKRDTKCRNVGEVSPIKFTKAWFA